MSPLSRRLPLLLVLLPVVACRPALKSGCHTADDCLAGRVCVAGTCQDRRLDGSNDSTVARETAADVAGDPPSDVAAERHAFDGDVAGDMSSLPVDTVVASPEALPEVPPDAPSDEPIRNADTPGEPSLRPEGAGQPEGEDAGDAAAAPLLLDAGRERPGDAPAESGEVPIGMDAPPPPEAGPESWGEPPREAREPIADVPLSPESGPELTDVPAPANPGASAWDAPSDVPAPEAGAPEAGLDARPDGRGNPCATSDDCPAPYVCNINTDGTCGLPVYTQVDVTHINTCAVVSDGTVRCWGGNHMGQLGPELYTTPRLPFTIPDQHDVRMVATGWSYTCTLHRSGQVDCWGGDYFGQLGCEQPSASSNGPLCTPFPAGSGVEQLVAGAARTCARMRDGTVECWGRNDHCDLGDGTNVDSTQPKPVVGVVDATAIATGLWQACAVLASSGLRCWGANDRGQLGNGTSDPICEPTTVLGLDGSGSKVLAVSPAEDHGCAVLADGEVRCFGSNDYGQLGAAQISATNSPVSCALAQPADLIAAGIWYTCAALRDRTVVCLGKGDVGQLGNGNLEPSLSPVPVALPAGTTLKSMATKYHHTCAVDQQGQIWCWGANEMGQLGNGATVDSSVPVLARISHKL